MKTRRHRSWIGSAGGWLLCGALLSQARGADTPAPTTTPAAETPAVEQAPIIALPPMIVAESSKAPPWLYATTGETEYLSRCSASTTRAYIEAELEIQRILAIFVPPEFFSHSSVPSVSLLAPLELKAAHDDTIAGAMADAEVASRRDANEIGRHESLMPHARFQSMPNLRLDDRDMWGVFTYIDEKTFFPDHMFAAHEAVVSRLRGASPMLPSWAIEGITGLYLQSRVRTDPIEVRRFYWMNYEETELLRADPEGRRVLLPAEELFAPDALLTPGNQHPARVATWRSQCVLFVRWAFDPANGRTREALWTFLRRATVEPTTEKLFTECFGFGYADLRDRLSDYLPGALNTPLRLPTGKLPPLPRFEVKPANSVQVARLRGEWERLEVPFVRERHPTFASRYADQARTTLRRAVGSGERDPMLVAALGLCELDAGDASAARPWLEQAAASGVVRPRVHFEVARLRWEQLMRESPEAKFFTLAQLEPVLRPLRTSLKQTPQLPEACLMLADVWLRCSDPVLPEDLPQLIDATGRFRRIPDIAYRVALLLYRHKRPAEAVQLLAVSVKFLGDPATRTQYRELYEAIVKPKKS